METKEFALVLFTVLSQASVGAFILLSWLRLRNRSEAMDAVYRRSIAVLLPIMAVALVASLFHLGRPMLAFTSLRRLATSWLSRRDLLQRRILRPPGRHRPPGEVRTGSEGPLGADRPGRCRGGVQHGRGTRPP